MSICFLILSHTQPDSLVNLAKDLESFDSASIMIHLDASQRKSHGVRPELSPYVIPESLETARGTFSIVEATMCLLNHALAADVRYNWFVLLSESDALCADPIRVSLFYKESVYDAYCSGEMIDANVGGKRAWQKLCSERYFMWARPVSLLGRTIHFPPISSLIHRMLRNSFGKMLLGSRKCFAGSQWWSLNRTAAKYVSEVYYSAEFKKIKNRYRRVPVPDESLFQVILFNSASLRICNDNLRYIDWKSENFERPRTLGSADSELAHRSGAHFARKVQAPLMSSLYTDLQKIRLTPPFNNKAYVQELAREQLTFQAPLNFDPEKNGRTGPD